MQLQNRPDSIYFKFLPDDIRNKQLMEGEFPFSQYLFWDYAIDTIDLSLHKNYIIERVITRGSLADFYFLLQIYDSEQIKDGLRKSKSLDKKTVHFCSNYFEMPINEMHASSFYS